MKYYKLISANGSSRFTVEQQEGLLADLTSVDENLSGLEVIALTASLSGVGIDQIAERIIASGQPQILKMEEVLDEKSDMRLARAGATYNKDLSQASESYVKIYQAERPMLFFKATPQRCVGPFESVGIREDSAINIPEPELAFVLYQGEIIGYTIANDMSAVSLEAENTYYQPQAKVYNRSCAIGPCFVTAESKSNRGQACDFGSLSSNFPFDLFDTVLKIRRLSHFLSQLIDSGTDRRIISIELGLLPL